MKPGDKVSVISEEISGVIKEIIKDNALIVDDNGFEWEYKLTEIVLRAPEDSYALDDSLVLEKIKVDTVSIDIKITKKRYQDEVWEIDLHIEELVDSHTHMSNTEIVQKQLSVLKSFLDKAQKNGIKRCVVIHGKGKGVLKEEIRNYCYKLKQDNDVRLEFVDADYSNYGMGGATEIIFF